MLVGGTKSGEGTVNTDTMLRHRRGTKNEFVCLGVSLT